MLLSWPSAAVLIEDNDIHVNDIEEETEEEKGKGKKERKTKQENREVKKIRQKHKNTTKNTVDVSRLYKSSAHPFVVLFSKDLNATQSIRRRQRTQRSLRRCYIWTPATPIRQ